MIRRRFRRRRPLRRLTHRRPVFRHRAAFKKRYLRRRAIRPSTGGVYQSIEEVTLGTVNGIGQGANGYITPVLQDFSRSAALASIFGQYKLKWFKASLLPTGNVEATFNQEGSTAGTPAQAFAFNVTTWHDLQGDKPSASTQDLAYNLPLSRKHVYGKPVHRFKFGAMRRQTTFLRDNDQTSNMVNPYKGWIDSTFSTVSHLGIGYIIPPVLVDGDFPGVQYKVHIKAKWIFRQRKSPAS